MLKNKSKSRKPVHNRNSKKVYDRVLDSSVFKLIEQIPKQINAVSVFDSHKLNLKYAEALLSFCESKLADELDLLEFNKTDSVGEFIYSLTKLITDNEYKIVYDQENFCTKPVVDFTYKKIEYDWHWYIMEAKRLLEIKSRELQIGYCQLMKRFGKQTETSFIDHNYKSFCDSLNEYETDYIQQIFEEGELESEFEDFGEFQEHEMKPFRELKSLYDELVQQPIELCLEYKPKNKPERKLKELILRGLEIDFSLIHRFPDDEMPHSDDGDMVSYSQSFMLIYEYESISNEWMMERWNMEANEYGVTLPVNYHRFEDGRIINGPSESEEK